MSLLGRWKIELTKATFGVAMCQSFALGYIFIYIFLQSLYIKGKYSLISFEDAWLGHIFKAKHALECQMRSALRNPALQCGVSFMRIHAGSCEATHFFFFFFKNSKRSDPREEHWLFQLHWSPAGPLRGLEKTKSGERKVCASVWHVDASHFAVCVWKAELKSMAGLLERGPNN